MTDPLGAHGAIVCLLTLCVVTYRLRVTARELTVAVSARLSTPVRLVMAPMFYLVSCCLSEGLTLGTFCSGTTRMNLVRWVMGTSSTLLGPVPADVTPVISPPVVMFIE